MASYDEALQKMYSDRLTRFYRNYDEAKVASVPSRAEIKIDPWPARTHRSDDSRRWRIRALTQRGDGVKLGPRRRLDVVRVRMTERRRERTQQ